MESPRIIGRYALHERISSGGMATVFYGRLLGPVGFSRTVAIKQLHPQFSRDPDFVSMFVDEAHLAARIRHPSVVPVLDVVKSGRELYLVMDYVLGVSLGELIGAAARAGRHIPHAVVSAIIGGCLRGLHAAHETTGDEGELLGIVHRDVSPGNVLVGRDGLARVLDFGIAKAANRAQITRHGELKGKVGYMAPEQLSSGDVDRRADVYAMGVALWETLTRRRAYAGDSDEVFALRRRDGALLPPPSRHDPELAPFDALVMRALARAPEDRFQTAELFADALEACQPPAGIREVSRFVAEMVGEVVERRSRVAAELERAASPSEVRAAILEEVGVSIDDTPSISVSTWTDPSIDILDLVSAESERRLEPTTREIPSPPRPEPETRVVPPPELAESAAIALERRVEPLPPTSRLVPGAWDPPVAGEPSTPDWTDDTPREWSEPTIRNAPTPRPSSSWPWVVVGGTLAVTLGGAVAWQVLGDEAAPRPALPRASESPMRSSPEPPLVTTAAVVPTVDRLIEPPASASAQPSSVPPAQPRLRATQPVDPFDALGGRH